MPVLTGLDVDQLHLCAQRRHHNYKPPAACGETSIIVRKNCEMNGFKTGNGRVGKLWMVCVLSDLTFA